MSVGMRIKALREDKGYSQCAFARLLSVTPGTLCKYETDRIQVPIDVVVKISDLLDVSTDYILGLTEFLHKYSVVEQYYVDGVKTETLLKDIFALNSGNRITLSKVMIGLSLKNNVESGKNAEK